jgi:gamma-glutamylcyclotransferase (GGCT)/AIG2-like uncharacterized protein YtfP
MNVEQMGYRCPTAKVAGFCVLKNWELVFRGCASIERKKGGEVPAVIWEIDKTAELALDRYEGFPRLYRKEFIRANVNGKSRILMVYVMNPVRDYNTPTEYYFDVIKEGYKWAKYSINTLKNAVDRTLELKGAL